MKKNGVLILAASLSVLAVSCSPSYQSIKRMQMMEEGVSNPSTIPELKEALSKYEKRAMDLVSTQAQEGIWYKMLGTRYLDKQMYGEAYEAFKKALEIYPDNANLYYSVGMCASYMSNAILKDDPAGPAVYVGDVKLSFDPTLDGTAADRKMEYLRTAEEAFVRAIDINPDYYRAQYALGVLYCFQLGEYEKAIPPLEKFLQTQTRNSDGMFVLARAYFYLQRYDDAIALYDKIIELKPSADKVQSAQENKKAALDANYSK